eukprot:TRINITY_DN2438_c0_g1_i2.p1 TRINITY_DN2438_c0_g1~~TRINITY_DN2438_c0_g1_i2.p1  ORF type:complete len:324 (+),score=73.87 TRINITY_DN2438_c0_g1_i2:52-972(+)
MLSSIVAVAISLLLRSLAALKLVQYDAAMQQPSDRGMFIFHIAKTGGTSANGDIRRHVNAGNFSGSECCYPSREKLANTDVVTFLREPVSHVFTQWMHCKQNKDAWFNPQGLPQTLTAWLEHWTKVGDVPLSGGNDSLSEGNAFRCYMPINLQARAMSCTREHCRYTTAGLDSSILDDSDGSYMINEALARQRVAHDSFAVGLLEFYQESLCLMQAKRNHDLPEQCNCDNATAWNEFAMRNFTHNSTNHASEDKMTAADVKMIRELTSIDERLYEVAFERFKREIHEVEMQYGKRILCRPLERAIF